MGIMDAAESDPYAAQSKRSSARLYRHSRQSAGTPQRRGDAFQRSQPVERRKQQVCLEPRRTTPAGLSPAAIRSVDTGTATVAPPSRLLWRSASRSPAGGDADASLVAS